MRTDSRDEDPWTSGGRELLGRTPRCWRREVWSKGNDLWNSEGDSPETLEVVSETTLLGQKGLWRGLSACGKVGSDKLQEGSVGRCVRVDSLSVGHGIPRNLCLGSLCPPPSDPETLRSPRSWGRGSPTNFPISEGGGGSVCGGVES